MYWPYANARRLTTAPAGIALAHSAIHIAPTRDGAYWLALTPTALLVWSGRPCELLAALERSAQSIAQHGENVWADWNYDTNAIVVHTDKNVLLFYDVVATEQGVYMYGDSSYTPATASLEAAFQYGTGESMRRALQGVQLVFHSALQVDPGITSVAVLEDGLLLATRAPPAVQFLGWPGSELAPSPTTLLSSLPWVAEGAVTDVVYSRAMGMFVWRTPTHAYVAAMDEHVWSGTQFWDDASAPPCALSVNARFSLLALGLEDGRVVLFEFQSIAEKPAHSHTLALAQKTGKVLSLAWTPDGYALFVGFERGLSVWSTFGHLLYHSFREDWDTATRTFRDAFMFGVRSAFWGPGGTELFVVSTSAESDALVYCIPFVKSASATQMVPDQASVALALSDDSVFIYRGSEQRESSLIAPENDAWRHVPLPAAYLTVHWPIRYATLSSDGRFVAIAGRQGLAHFSCASGRWKLYESAAQEQSFFVRGGMLWFQHVLIAACDCDGEVQLRLYSRDQPLSNAHLLDLVVLPASVVVCASFDTSLLVYTTDNTLYHYLVTPTKEHIRLKLAGSISFDGIVGEPARVRAMSWMIPPTQQTLGNPADDLRVASIIFLIDGKLVLLQPSLADEESLSYDLQILHHQTEIYWTNLQGRGPLHNSLWGYDGHSLAVWPDVLTMLQSGQFASSAALSLHMYPVCILLAYGVVLGAEACASVRRTLDTVTFRQRIQTALFLDQLLRVYLDERSVEEAVEIAAPFRHLGYFAHALERLLHAALEEEADRAEPNPHALQNIVHFLDHYPQSLAVIVRAARKTEAARWPYLFRVVGRPQTLLRHALEAGDWDTARIYLLIVHELEDEETAVQLNAAVLHQLESHRAWDALKELLSFLRSVDDDGSMLHVSLQAASPFLELGSPLLGGAACASLRTPPRTPSQTRSTPPLPLMHSVHTLHQAARRASMTLSPSAMPMVHANGRIVMGTPGHSASPRP
ncbi:WD40 repeat protein [Malassezia vespertilionis]|uniref:WD40 repeat protein n=1 Tax=Malassezia vespertilionis TaxID=2020962 RepID=UPI0024B142E5|nr:WD40 repeat protein [Malassezia vespertilionis]WFD08571.1 WD40 repeat protein [Malassezia vespertilionis]